MRLHNILRQYFLCQFSLLSSYHSFTLRGKKKPSPFQNIPYTPVKELAYTSFPTNPEQNCKSIFNLPLIGKISSLTRTKFYRSFSEFVRYLTSSSIPFSIENYSLQCEKKKKEENFNVRKIQFTLNRGGVSRGHWSQFLLFILCLNVYAAEHVPAPNNSAGQM